MQVAADAQPHPEAPGRPGGNQDLVHLSGVHAGHPHFGTVRKGGNLAELRVDVQRVGKQHSPIADEEQAHGKEQHSPDDEGSDGSETF